MKFQLIIALIFALFAHVQLAVAEKAVDIDLKNAETKREDSKPEEKYVPEEHVLEQQNEPKVSEEANTGIKEQSASEDGKNSSNKEISARSGSERSKVNENANQTSESSGLKLNSVVLDQSRSKTDKKLDPDIQSEENVNETAGSPKSRSQPSESEADLESQHDDNVERESDASEVPENNSDLFTKQSPIIVHSLDNDRSHDIIPMIDVKGRSVEEAATRGDENSSRSSLRRIGLMPQLLSRQRYIQGGDVNNLHQIVHSVTPIQFPLPVQHGIRPDHTDSSYANELRRTGSFENLHPVQSYGQLSHVHSIQPRTMDNLDGIPSSNAYPYNPAEKNPNIFAKLAEASQYPIQHVSLNNLNLPPLIKTYDQLVAQNYNPYLFMRHLR